MMFQTTRKHCLFSPIAPQVGSPHSGRATARFCARQVFIAVLAGSLALVGAACTDGEAPLLPETSPAEEADAPEMPPPVSDEPPTAPDTDPPDNETDEPSCDPDSPGLVFLNRFPPRYASGPNDAATNQTPLAAPGNTDNSLSDDQWDRFVACFRDAVSPFHVAVLESEPEPEPEASYVELAVLGVWGRWEEAPAMTGAACGRSPRPIAMVFADAPSPDYEDVVDKTCRYAVGIWAASVAELDYVDDSMDFMASHPRGPGQWRDIQVACPDGACSCTGMPTQNSYQTMLDDFGPACGPEDEPPGTGDGDGDAVVEQGGSCVGDVPCGPGLECLEHTGFGDAEGPPLASCEIPCESALDCPMDQACINISDGPGFVCQ